MKNNTLTYKLCMALLFFTVSQFAIANQSWKFKVYLDEKEIGEHTFYVASENNKTYVNINAEFNVYVFFINAYAYTHENYEVWHNQCLHSVRSRTSDNGDEFYVQAEYVGERFNINSSSGQFSIEGCIKTFTYWDPSFLNSQRLLNTQTGEIKPVTVEKVGEEAIMVRNNLTSANRFRLTTDDFVIDLWYSKNNEWLALNSTTNSGLVLRYKIQ